MRIASRLFALLSFCALLAGVATQVQAEQPSKQNSKGDVVARLRAGLPPSKVEEALAEIVVAKRRDAVPAVMELMQHRRPKIREMAIDALAALGGSRVQTPLLYALQDPASGVREAAARGLGEVGTQRAFKPLLAAHERGVAQALVAIGKLARPTHVSELLDRTQEDAVTALAPALAIMLERKDFPLRGKLMIIRKVAGTKTDISHRFLVDWLSRFKTDGHPLLRKELFEALKGFEQSPGANPPAPTTSAKKLAREGRSS
jgi:HEAT repeat protein